MNKALVILLASSTVWLGCTKERKYYYEPYRPLPPKVVTKTQAVTVAQFAAEAGNYSSPLVTKNSAVVFAAGQDVYFLNADGSQKAVFKAGDKVLGRPAELSDGTVVFGSLDKNIYFLNADGTLKSKFAAQGAVYASPVVLADDVTVVGSFDGYVYFLNPDGREKAKFKTGDWVMNSAAVQSDGTVVIPSTDRKMYFLNSDGSLKSAVPVATLGLSNPVVLADDGIVFGSSDKNIYFLNADGSEKFKFTTAGEVLSQPAVLADGTVVAASDDGKLYYLNAATGEEVRALELAGGHITTPLELPDGGLIVGAGKTQYFLNASGAIQSKLELPAGAANQTQFQPALAGDAVVVIASESIHSTAYFLKLITVL